MFFFCSLVKGELCSLLLLLRVFTFLFSFSLRNCASGSTRTVPSTPSSTRSLAFSSSELFLFSVAIPIGSHFLLKRVSFFLMSRSFFFPSRFSLFKTKKKKKKKKQTNNYNTGGHLQRHALQGRPRPPPAPRQQRPLPLVLRAPGHAAAVLRPHGRAAERRLLSARGVARHGGAEPVLRGVCQTRCRRQDGGSLVLCVLLFGNADAVLLFFFFPVLFVYSMADEVVLQNVVDFGGKKLTSIESAHIDLDQIGGSKEHAPSSSDTAEQQQPPDDAEKRGDALRGSDLDGLLRWLQEDALRAQVSQVVESARLVDTPVLIADYEGAQMRRMMKYMDPSGAQQMQLPPQKLEINAGHPLIVRLASLRVDFFLFFFFPKSSVY